MRNGDISNCGGIRIAVRVEDTVLKHNDDKHHFWNKFMQSVFDPLYDYKVDIGAVNVLRHLYVTTDYNLVLVVNYRYKNSETVQNLLERLNWCDVCYVSSDRNSDIATMLLTKEWEYYVDDCYERRASLTMSPDYALSMTDFVKAIQKI